ncbi:MAG: isochorismatase family protein [Phycisphaerae bacterium]|nr:isochorismatase family protein [Phycisphaerae bacterium]
MNFDLILLDIEAQRDFFVSRGACYTSEAPQTRFNLYALFHWARQNDQPIMSTVLRVPPGRLGPLADVPHCIEGTSGEKKLAGTVVRPYLNLGLQNTTDLPDNLFEHYRQVIFEKRNTDIFLHARAERLLTELPEVSFILCGAGIAHGIVQAAVGLRMRGFGVVLATDAVLGLNDPQVEMAYSRMSAKGVLFLKTREIIKPHRLAPPGPAFRAISAVGHGK